MLHDPATLTAAIHNTAARAVPFATETFETVQIGQGGKIYDLGAFDTLDEAIERCAIHKAHFYVRVTNQLTGAVLLKFYQVKKKGRGERRYAEYQTRVVCDTYAEHLFDLDGGAL